MPWTGTIAGTTLGVSLGSGGWWLKELVRAASYSCPACNCQCWASSNDQEPEVILVNEEDLPASETSEAVEEPVTPAPVECTACPPRSLLGVEHELFLIGILVLIFVLGFGAGLWYGRRRARSSSAGVQPPEGRALGVHRVRRGGGVLA